MGGHLHVGILEGLVTAAYVILVLFFLRMLAIRLPDGPIKKGIAALVM